MSPTFLIALVCTIALAIFVFVFARSWWINRTLAMDPAQRLKNFAKLYAAIGVYQIAISALVLAGSSESFGPYFMLFSAVFCFITCGSLLRNARKLEREEEPTR